MSATDAADEAGRWLQGARADLDAAELAASGTLAPNIGCYHAQQTVEKALKAILILLQILFPFRHDLDELRDLIPAGWHVVQAYPDLSTLSAWGVQARYPGNWPQPTEADCREAARQARDVWETVLVDINRHGFDTGLYR